MPLPLPRADTGCIDPLPVAGRSTLSLTLRSLTHCCCAAGLRAWHSNFKFKPPRWCQHLAGLDFAPPLPLASQLQGGEHTALVEGLGTYRKQQRVVHVIDRLRALKTGDEALK